MIALIVLAAVVLGSLANGYGVFEQPKPIHRPARAEAPADTTEGEEPDTAMAVVPVRESDE